MDIIHQPNLKPSGSTPQVETFQAQWSSSPWACGRPPSDFSIRFFCYTISTNPGTWIVSEGADYDAFERCCPTVTTAEVSGSSPIQQTTVYRTQAGCDSHFCFTANKDLAFGFNQCVKDRAKLAIEEAAKNGTLRRNETTESMYSGRCEFIDFENLNKDTNLKVTYPSDYPGGSSSGGSVHHPWSLKATIGFMGLALLLFGVDVI